MSPLIAQTVTFLSRFAASAPECSKSGPLGLPTWYKYLEVTKDAAGKCSVSLAPPGSVNGFDPSRIWLIGLAVIEILLRVGVLVTIGFIIYGGFQYMFSQGEPDRTTAAKNTILNALIGLVITILAVGAVNFIGSKLGG